MKLNTETLDDSCVNKIGSQSEGLGVIGGSLIVGVITSFSAAGGSNIGPVPPYSASVDTATSGECNVTTSSCVAGDWFTSDAEGLAIKTETGFALGRILADPVDGLALAVIGAVNL